MQGLFHCYLHALLANLGDYDWALLGREQNVAIYWFCSAESLSVKSIEADCLVVVETGDVDETTGWLDGDATHWDVVDAITFKRAWGCEPIEFGGGNVGVDEACLHCSNCDVIASSEIYLVTIIFTNIWTSHFTFIFNSFCCTWEWQFSINKWYCRSFAFLCFPASAFKCLNCSKSAPGFGCLIIRECWRRNMQSGIFYIWVTEYIPPDIRDSFSVTIDVFYISTVFVFRSDWLPIICS